MKLNAISTYLSGLLIGNVLLAFFVLIGTLFAGRSKYLTRYQIKEQILYFLIIGLLFVTSLFAIIANKGRTVLAGIPLVLLVAVFRFGKQSNSANITNSLSKAIYLFIGFCLLYTFNFFQHDFHNSETIIRGIDEPFYYFISKLLGTQPFESYLAHFTLLNESLVDLPNFYHYFDLWLFKLVINSSFFLDNDLNSYWLILKPLTLSVHYYILFLLFSSNSKITEKWGFALAILTIYTIFIIPGVSALGNINNFLFYPKFLYALFLIWINYRFFTGDMSFKFFISFLAFAPIISPLSLPFAFISLVFVFVQMKDIKWRISKNSLLLYLAICLMALIFFININIPSNTGVPEARLFDFIMNKTYSQRAIYYMTRAYGVKIIYYVPILLIPVLLYFTVEKNELIKKLFPYRVFFIVSCGYILTGLFLTGIMHFNREHWQFSAQFTFPPLLFIVIILAITSAPLLFHFKRLKYYMLFPFFLLLFSSIRGIPEYHFIPQDFALSNSTHLKNAITIKDKDFNNRFLFGYMINSVNLNNEYKSNANFPFNGGLMYQINNKAIPVYLANFNLIDSFFYDKTSYRLMKNSPFYNYAMQNTKDSYEESAKKFIELNNIKAFFIENNLNYNIPIDSRLYYVLVDNEGVGKYYFHKEYFNLNNHTK